MTLSAEIAAVLAPLPLTNHSSSADKAALVPRMLHMLMHLCPAMWDTLVVRLLLCPLPLWLHAVHTA